MIGMLTRFTTFVVAIMIAGCGGSAGPSAPGVDSRSQEPSDPNGPNKLVEAVDAAAPDALVAIEADVDAGTIESGAADVLVTTVEAGRLGNAPPEAGSVVEAAAPDAVVLPVEAGADAADDVKAEAALVLRCMGTATCTQTADQGSCGPVGCDEASIFKWPDGTEYCFKNGPGVLRCKPFLGACVSNGDCDQSKTAAECAWDTRLCAWAPKVVCLVPPTPCAQVPAAQCGQHPGCVLSP